MAEDAALRLWRLWQQGHRPDLSVFLSEIGPIGARELAAVLRVEQTRRWALGQRIPAEQYLRAGRVLMQQNRSASTDPVHLRGPSPLLALLYQARQHAKGDPFFLVFFTVVR
jgi:hypothetical protein